MKILTHGCSFTNYHWPSWPKFVEWFTDHEVINRGRIDSSNETISRDVIDSAMEFKSGISHLYIMWSSDEHLKTLEHILRTQHFLNNYSLRYTMMISKQDVLNTNLKLYNEIDWTKFVFYNSNQGLHEYSINNFKKYYYLDNTHPPPIAHYYWTKNIIFQSELFAPKEKLTILQDFWQHYDKYFRKEWENGAKWPI
jgi:hypothetical protein